jgi:hypothetical protein
VSFRRLWTRYLEELVSCSRSSSLGMYIEVVTELYDDCELAGQLAHVDSHCDEKWRGRNHSSFVENCPRSNKKSESAQLLY